jgi:hypothetical protein
MTSTRSEATPRRARLSRAKGWRMPPDTVKVDRSTPWGNPFIVGKHGTRAECVELFTRLLQGYLCISKGAAVAKAATAYREHAQAHLHELKGKHLACWCDWSGPCHADVLLLAANGGTVRINPPRLLPP